MDALSINNLHKTYGSGFNALKGVTFDVKEGDFFGLLGPNGAGKTTTIGIITSLVTKTKGSVKVFGIDICFKMSIADELSLGQKRARCCICVLVYAETTQPIDRLS